MNEEQMKKLQVIQELLVEVALFTDGENEKNVLNYCNELITELEGEL